MASALATARLRQPFSLDGVARTYVRCCGSGTASATQAGFLSKMRCAPAKGSRSSASSAPRISKSFRLRLKHFPRRRQPRWRPITTSRDIDGCSILGVVPARFCSPSCDGTRRCAAHCSSCPAIARRRVGGWRVSLREAAHNVDLLRKLRGQAEQGTQLLLVDLWMDSGHTQPPAAALMSGEFLIISGEGQAYCEDDAEAWLRDTGWRRSERRPLGGPHSVIIAEAI
jgi:hypothetical protein